MNACMSPAWNMEVEQNKGGRVYPDGWHEASVKGEECVYKVQKNSVRCISDSIRKEKQLFDGLKESGESQ